jgi:hypothetical protein
MQHKVRLVTTAIILTVAPLSYANTTRFFSATNCNGRTAADNDLVTRFAEGCFSIYAGPGDIFTCSRFVTVALPITGNNSANVNFDSVTVNFVEASQAESISCTIFVANSTGTMFMSSTLSTVVSGSPTVPVRGTLTWTGASLPNAGNSIANVRTQTIYCDLPGKIFQFGDSCFGVTNFSGVTSYSVNTVGS